MAISFFAGHRARELIRLALWNGAEPSWDKALKTRDDSERVRIPQITQGGDTTRLLAPAAGGDAA